MRPGCGRTFVYQRDFEGGGGDAARARDGDDRGRTFDTHLTSIFLSFFDTAEEEGPDLGLYLANETS